MSTIDKIDVTARAIEGGWILPAGWTVSADMSYDDGYWDGPDGDCYTPTQVDAFRNGEWSYVYVSVSVTDNAGREWGRAGIGGTEYGEYTLTDEDDNVTGTVWVDPLNAPLGDYNVVREYDLIGEALRDAVSALERFGAPVLAEPTDVNYTGL